MATAISTDGSTVVGTADYDDNIPGAQGFRKEHAFSYDIASRRMTDLGSLAYESYATAVNRDGSAIVGYANMGDGNQNAFYYDANTQSMIALKGTSYFTSSAAFTVSADGSVVAGRMTTKEPKKRSGDHFTKDSQAVLWKIKKKGSGAGGSQYGGGRPSFPPPAGAGGFQYDTSGPLSYNNNFTNSSQVVPMQLVDVAITTDDDDSEKVAVNGGTLTPPDPVTPTAGGDARSVAEISPTDGDIEELIVGGGSLTPPDPVTSPDEDEDTLSGADFFDVTMVNVLDSEKTLIEMARKDNEFHDLYRSNLHNFNNEHCALEDKSYCIGVFGTATSVSRGGHEGNTGIHGAVRLAPE